jgi:hypothetical protein
MGYRNQPGPIVAYSRLIKRILVSGFAGLVASLAIPAMAGADPLTITLDRAEANVDGVPAETGNDSTFTGEIDTADGDLTFLEANVDLADFELNFGEGLVFTLTTTASSDYTGNFNSANGQLTLTGTVDAEVSGCAWRNLPLNLSTENNAPFDGFRFAGGLAGPGAAVASWADLPPVEGPPQCSGVNDFVDGPGGVMLTNPAPPTPTLISSVEPTSAKVKQGKSKTFTVHLSSEDGPSATDAEVCVTLPKALRAAGGQTCKTVTDVTGTEQTVPFRIKAKRKAKPKRYTLNFGSTASGYVAAASQAKLKVRKR